jgi:hypothetical protein
LPSNDKCGIQIWGLGYYSNSDGEDDYDSEDALDEDEFLEIQEISAKIDR